MKRKIVPATAAAIDRAAAIIREGGLVVFPTETVYGLGADALQPTAVARIFEAKRRPAFDPLIVHISELPELEPLTAAVDGRVRLLAARFWPGPLTLVLPKTDRVPDIVTSGLPSVAVRMPSHPTARALIAAAGTPIAAPSANLFGSLSPTDPAHLAGALLQSIDLVLDGGRCPVGVESTVLSLTDREPRILRFGGLPRSDIEAVIGPVAVNTTSSSNPQSPGQVPKHYAPGTPLVVLGSAPVPAPGLKVGLLALAPDSARDTEPYAVVRYLSPRGDLREAASNLFSALHDLDAMGLDLIAAEPVDETGLGAAIMDRLRRASYRD